MEKGKIKNYFPGGNTAEGFHSFYDYLPYQAEEVYIIKGGPGTGKSTLMKNIGSRAVKQGFDIEYHWCSSDNNSLDGVVIPANKVAILDGTAPHLRDPKYPGVVEEIIYVGKYWDKNILKTHCRQIMQLTDLISKKFDKCYHYLKIAKLIYQEWQNYYQEGFYQEKANQKTATLIKSILPDKSSYTSPGRQRHLFGSAITPGGMVNHLDNITEDLDKRYIIKGEPGTGKSTMISTIASAICKHGFDVILLHCALIPESIDTIIIPELNTTLINTTVTYDPVIDSQRDYVIDMMECVNKNLIANNITDITETRKLFQLFMNKAVKQLKNAKENHDKLENFYIDAMNFDKEEQLEQKLFQKIISKTSK